LLQLDPFAERLICLGESAALLKHRDKRVWLAEQFNTPLTAPVEGVSYEIAIGEARVVACENGGGEVGRTEALHLPVPADAESWQRASVALAS
jgi:hypothetical protein